jgi:CBS domain-containing protein
MNKQPVILAPNDTIANAMQLMTDKIVRYILIVENEQLLAIVSIGDLVKYIIDQQDQTIQHLNKYISS